MKKHTLIILILVVLLSAAGQEIYAFDQIKSLEIRANLWDSRPDTYDNVVEIAGQPKMKFGDFPSQPEAARYLTALQNMLANRV